MYLKRDRRSLFQRPHSQRIAPRRETVRKDSAVHVSLSSDSVFKHPGIVRPPLQLLEACRNSAHPITVGCLFTIPVRSFGGTKSRQIATWRVFMPEAVYRLARRH